MPAWVNREEVELEEAMAAIRADTARGLSPAQIAACRAAQFDVSPSTVYGGSPLATVACRIWSLGARSDTSPGKSTSVNRHHTDRALHRGIFGAIRDVRLGRARWIP
jgi:hypothetical protein